MFWYLIFWCCTLISCCPLSNPLYICICLVAQSENLSAFLFKWSPDFAPWLGDGFSSWEKWRTYVLPANAPICVSRVHQMRWPQSAMTRCSDWTKFPWHSSDGSTTQGWGVVKAYPEALTTTPPPKQHSLVLTMTHELGSSESMAQETIAVCLGRAWRLAVMVLYSRRRLRSELPFFCLTAAFQMEWNVPNVIRATGVEAPLWDLLMCHWSSAIL